LVGFLAFKCSIERLQRTLSRQACPERSRRDTTKIKSEIRISKKAPRTESIPVKSQSEPNDLFWKFGSFGITVKDDSPQRRRVHTGYFYSPFSATSVVRQAHHVPSLSRDAPQP
jgi:hypothetical protein